MKGRCKTCGDEFELAAHPALDRERCPKCAGPVTAVAGRRNPSAPGSPVRGSGIHQVNDVVRHYRLQECLGRGGFGEVWKAEDADLRRGVAIKVLTSIGAGEVDRFYHEARSVAALDHENITPIHEVFSTDRGHYIVMKLLSGRNLDQAGLSVSATLEALYLVARAIDHAHRRGVIHRDLKPANIVIDRGPDRREHRVFVCDFGLALTREDETLRGGIVGTPAYMSPEQAWGEVATPLSDVYSLGATLLAALTGEPPFRADTLEDLVWLVRRSEPPRLRSRRPELHEALEALISAAMAKDPKARPSSAGDFAEELRGLLNTGRVYHRSIPDAPREVTDISAELRRGFGKYIVVNALGRNPLGPLFRAWDTSLQCFVAIRVLEEPENAAARQAQDLALREARLCVALRHPAIPPIFEIGQYKGHAYLARAFVEGENLARIELAPAQRLQAMRKAAEAVHYLHGEGITHGHIAPENIIVGADGRVTLAGLGLGALLVDHPGAVAYRAPERQFLPSIDIFGLGMTLYEGLLGRPVERQNLRRLGSIGDLEPLPPSVEPAVREIVAKAVDVSPRKRYASALEMALAIERATSPKS